MNTQLISVHELRRNFGSIKKQLTSVEFIITDRGQPIAQLTAPSRIKRQRLLQLAGAWKDTDLDNDKLWKDVLKRKSRKISVSL